MIMKKYILFILFNCLAFMVYGQQDPLLSQYQFNQLWINPAYAGVNGVTSIDLQFRKQWTGVDGAPTTTLLTGNTSLVENNIGLGFSLLSDKIGISKNTEINLVYSYQIQLGDGSLSFGLQTGLLLLKYDYSELNLEDLTDEDFIAVDNGLTKFNIGFGAFYSTDNFYLGISIPKILNVEEEFSGGNIGQRYNRHYYLSSGVIFDLSASNISLKPYTIIRFADDTPVSADLGISALLVDMLWAGIFTRNFNDFGISANLNLIKGLRFGYIGEFSAASVPDSKFSTHEISLGMDLELFERQSVVKRNY